MQKNKLLQKIEIAAIEISEVTSLLSFLVDYFTCAKPDAATLLCRYKMYSDLCIVSQNIVRENGINLLKLFDDVEREGICDT